MANMTCPVCGMKRAQWQSNGGDGVTVDGKTYCCQGCAYGRGCTCVPAPAGRRTMTDALSDPAHMKPRGRDIEAT